MSKLVEIQALRAAAALAVAVLHARHEAGLLSAAGPPAGLGGLAWEAGVDVFFVISGFVMVIASERLFGRREAARGFLARRVARVVPLYWLTTILVLAVALAAPGLLSATELRPGFVAASFLFVPAARSDGLVQPLFSLGWTLNYEMMFYLLFAFALALPRRRAVAAVAGGLAGLVLLGRLVPVPQPLAFWSDPITLEFAAGMAVGALRAEGLTLGGTPRLVLGATGSGLLLLAAGGPDLLGVPRALLYGGPATLLVAACGLGRARPSDGMSARARLALALGDASYAIYLVHPFVLRALRQVVGIVAPAVPSPAFIAAGLTATVLAALLTSRFVERPLTRLARRILDPRPRREVSA